MLQQDDRVCLLWAFYYEIMIFIATSLLLDYFYCSFTITGFLLLDIK